MSLISKSFRDFSLTFEKNAVTNDILSLKNEAAIKESVKNIVLYNFYEKPFDPFSVVTYLVYCLRTLHLQWH